MLLGLDHIVIAVRDLEQATADYRELGFTVVPGGRHPVGTYNSLIAFADGSYVELISFYRENPEHRWWAALQKGGGLVDFCMQTDNLTADTAAFRRAGVKIDDPVPWSRTRPDGYELKWLLSLARENHRGVAPFLVQDQTPRDERVPREKSHKNGAVGIGKVVVAVEQLETVAHWYKSVLGHDGEPVQDAALGDRGLRFAIGPHCVELLKPSAPHSPLAEWLKSRGPSPYAAIFRSELKTLPALEISRTHGANLSFET